MDSKIGHAEGPGDGEAELANPGLADLLEEQVGRRFSGCIELESDPRRGLIFMRAGQVIHADAGQVVGEDALFAMATWIPVRFALQPNVETTRATIRRGWELLRPEIASALARPAKSAAPSPGSKPQTIAEVTERVRRLPGVDCAVVQTKEGQRAGDPSSQGEALAGQTIYLSTVAKQLGAVFGSGELQSAAVQGTKHHLLLLATKSHYLSILGNGKSRLAALETEVRKTLSGNR
jgi:predicted regulator of Ras-like GTPase activity (Roadblock/LC7/MglB family)